MTRTIQIKSRFNGSVLFEGKFGSLKLCVEAAVEARADLAGADLAGANLARANLAGANLAGALKIKPEEIPIIPTIDAAIEAEIDAGGVLDMGSWHGPADHWCGTTH